MEVGLNDAGLPLPALLVFPFDHAKDLTYVTHAVTVGHMSERMYPTRVAGAPRPERREMHRMTIDLPVDLGAWLKAESETAGEPKVGIIEAALVRERKRRARQRKAAPAAA